MKALEIIKTEKIESTDFSMEVNIITLESIPSVEQQNQLFENDSVILEF